MILHKLLFPGAATCTREHMYYKSEEATVFMEEPCVRFSRGGKLSAMTYFNSFCVSKWKKYTTLSNLQLRLEVEGEFLVRIHRAYRLNGSVRDLCLLDKHICCAQQETVRVSIPLEAAKGTYYFCLTALTDGARFFGGAYETDVDVGTLPDVKIGLGICAAHGENTAVPMLDSLRREILEDPQSPLYGKLEVFLSDNSRTLPGSLETGNTHIFPNKDLGRAGGAARCMIEISKVREERGITHILLMDDVRVNPDSLLRMYAMLRLMKPKYRDAFIGGHILKLDQPQIQREAAALWNRISRRPVKQNYDLENFDCVLKNEIEDKVNCLGWQFCCMPANVISEENLPLPIFTGYEDVEFCLRNGKKFITLNGVCVWKESSECKYVAGTSYYAFRNLCIINAIRGQNPDGKTLRGELKKRVRECVLTYRYREAELCMLGVLHYLKGIDWLMAHDGERLNLELTQLEYKKQPIEQVNTMFAQDSYEKKLKPRCAGRKTKLIRKLTFNGYLLPANRTVLVPACKPDPQLFFRVKRAFNYEEATGTAFVTARDWKAVRDVLKKYCKTVSALRKKE